MNKFNEVTEGTLKGLVEARNGSTRYRQFAHNLEIDVVKMPKDIYINLKCMYHFNGLINFDLLSQLSEATGSKLIDLENEEYYPGCDSCDWGSVSKMTIHIRRPE